MIKGALKKPKGKGPMPEGSVDYVPPNWDGALNLSSPDSLTVPSDASIRTPSLLSSVDTVTSTGRSRSVGFSSGLPSISSGNESVASLGLQVKEGKQIYRIYRMHTRMKFMSALVVEEVSETCEYFIDYGSESDQERHGFYLRFFRGQDARGELIYICTRGKMSNKYELVRMDGTTKLKSTVSQSGIIKTKYHFKGYDGASFAWKEKNGGLELGNYTNKVTEKLGAITFGMQTMKQESYISINEATADPRTLELFLIVGIAVEDYKLQSDFSAHDSSDEDRYKTEV